MHHICKNKYGCSIVWNVELALNGVHQGKIQSIVFSSTWLPPVICFFFFSSAAENCSGYHTCAQCLEQPACGWCMDPSNTGQGQCMEGSYRGPIELASRSATTKSSNLDIVLDASICPAENWSFITCPGTVTKMVNCQNILTYSPSGYIY